MVLFDDRTGVVLSTFDSHDTVGMGILKEISGCLRGYAGVSLQDSPSCVIRRWDDDHREEAPECRNYVGTPKIFDHEILLECELSSHANLAYQFAHEFCHHLINGRLDGLNHGGQKWFEEALCYTCGIFFLRYFSESHPLPAPQSTTPDLSFRYLHQYLQWSTADLYQETLHDGFLRKWLPTLQDGSYHQQLYRALGLRLSHVFWRQPGLWRIIALIGDSTQWASIESLLFHLLSETVSPVRESVEEIRRILLG